MTKLETFERAGNSCEKVAVKVAGAKSPRTEPDTCYLNETISFLCFVTVPNPQWFPSEFVQNGLKKTTKKTIHMKCLIEIQLNNNKPYLHSTLFSQSLQSA